MLKPNISFIFFFQDFISFLNLEKSNLRIITRNIIMLNLEQIKIKEILLNKKVIKLFFFNNELVIG